MASEKEYLNNKFEMLRRNLALNEEKAAGFGALNVPTYFQIEIEDTKKQIEETLLRLAALETTPAPTSPRNQRQEIRKLTFELEMAQDIDDFEMVIQKGERILELDPAKHLISLSVRNAYFWLGCSLLEQESYQLAMQNFDEAIKLDAEFADGYLKRGEVYLQLKHYQQALKEFSRSIALKPLESVQTYYKRGEIYLLQKQFDLAIADFDRAIGLDGEFAEAYQKRSVAHRINGNAKKAEEDNGLAVIIYFYRGLKASENKHNELAIEAYSKVLDLDSKYKDAYINRGYANFSLKEYEKALADYNKALKLDPKNAVVYNNRGLVYNGLKEYEKALADFDKALELDQKYTLAYMNRGFAYSSLKEYKKAITDYNNALELDPNNADAYNYRGNNYLGLKEQEKAITDYNKALELNSKYAKAYYNRGLAYKQMGNIERARRDFEKADELGLENAKQALAKFE